jgi:hypothetical protein
MIALIFAAPLNAGLASHPSNFDNPNSSNQDTHTNIREKAVQPFNQPPSAISSHAVSYSPRLQKAQRQERGVTDGAAFEGRSQKISPN